MPEITKGTVWNFPFDTTLSTLFDGFENTVIDSTLWTETTDDEVATKEARTVGNFATGSNRLTVTVFNATLSRYWQIESVGLPDAAVAIAVTGIGGVSSSATVTYSFGNATDGWTDVGWAIDTGETRSGTILLLPTGDQTYAIYGPGGESAKVSKPNGAQLKIRVDTGANVSLVLKLDECRYAF